MQFKIHKPRPPVTEADVKAFEQRHSVVLPKPYRDFLLVVNGGMPFPMHVVKGFGFCAFDFYSLNHRPYGLESLCISSDWEEAYENGYLEIARDPGGSHFLISTRGDDVGEVFFLDREVLLRDSDEPIRVARSFDAFLDSLEPIRDED